MAHVDRSLIVIKQIVPSFILVYCCLLEYKDVWLTRDRSLILRQMERMMGGAAKGKAREAQDLVYDAWKAHPEAQAWLLARCGK